MSRLLVLSDGFAKVAVMGFARHGRRSAIQDALLCQGAGRGARVATGG